jgi:hypothetical protein
LIQARKDLNILNMLQAKMTLNFRKKKTISEIIDTITRIALRHENELLQPEKLPPFEKDPAMAQPIDWGVKTDASRVDEYIYTED